MPLDRPLLRDRQLVMDQLDEHPIWPDPVQYQTTVVANVLVRRAGFTTLLCEWIARTSHYRTIQIYPVANNQILYMTLTVRDMDGVMANCVFGPDGRRVDIVVAITHGSYELENEEGDMETVWYERVILTTFPGAEVDADQLRTD